MKDFMKKYGVLALIGCILVGFVGFYAFDISKDKVKGKKVNGNDVVFSVNGTDVTADTFYDELYANYGIDSVYNLFEKAVLDEAYETTDEMKELAEFNAASIISNYQNSYGFSWESELEKALKGAGYNSVDDLQSFLVAQSKYENMLTDYLERDPEGVLAEYLATSKPRVLSHVLVKMEDPTNPTEEELAKVQAVEDALASGQPFATVASTYSDDTGSAVNGGNLGWSDANTSFVPEFLEAGLALNEGETSEWVVTTYGYHMIRCEASTLDSLKTNPDFLQNVLTAVPALQTKALWEKAEEVGMTMDEDVKTALRTYMGLD